MRKPVALAAGIANSGMGALYVPGTEKDIGDVKTRVKPELFRPGRRGRGGAQLHTGRQQHGRGRGGGDAHRRRAERLRRAGRALQGLPHLGPSAATGLAATAARVKTANQGVRALMVMFGLLALARSVVDQSADAVRRPPIPRPGDRPRAQFARDQGGASLGSGADGHDPGRRGQPCEIGIARAGETEEPSDFGGRSGARFRRSDGHGGSLLPPAVQPLTHTPAQTPFPAPPPGHSRPSRGRACAVGRR